MSTHPGSKEPALHPARDFVLAVATLTAFPVRATWPPGERTDAPGYYPLVGLGLGGLAYGAVRLLERAGWTGGAPLVIAALVVAMWSLATRMLHWDGLGDVADGFWAHEPGRRLEIMSDSTVGAFAVTTIALLVVLEVAAVSEILRGDAAPALVVVPAFGRAAATFGAWFGTPARPEGLGASVTGRPRLGALMPAGVVLAALVAVCTMAWGIRGATFSAVGIVVALGVPHLIARRFGGVTGDVLGAGVVITETLLFVVLALLAVSL